MTVALRAEQLQISAAEIEAACAQVGAKERSAWNWPRRASPPITKGKNLKMPIGPIARALNCWRWTPISAAGLYVPGGLQAILFGFDECDPGESGRSKPPKRCGACPGGILNPLVLLACKIAGVDEVYRIGGAQAIAALAYGTQTIAPVDKITGQAMPMLPPQNAAHLKVGIDMIAGPSEILVIADAEMIPLIAGLSQAEHDEACNLY